MDYKVNLDSLPHIFDEVIKKGLYRIYSLYCKSLFKFWRVNYGIRFKAIGRIRVKRIPGSKISIGDNCTFISLSIGNLIGINRRCILSTQTPNAEIIIGNDCGFSGTVIGSFKKITIGNNVKCGANTLITDSDWHLDDFRSGEPNEIHIGDNVWLGINCVVLKGVTIGKNSLIGANSVVTKNIEANCIAAGNPCKVIKYLEPNDSLTGNINQLGIIEK